VSDPEANPRSRRPARGKRVKPIVAADTTSSIVLGPLDGYIAFHLRRAQETALRAFITSSSQPDFKPGRFAALMVIRLNPGLSQVDVCRAIGRDKSTISPLIRDLERDGLILRETSERDRRVVTLRLTPRGNAALDRLLTHVQAHDRRLDDIVGDAKPELIALLKKIAAALS
jgi:DNA-binding MarR family transcriptional regulator